MSTFSTSELAQLKIIEDEVNSYLNSKQKSPKMAVGVNSALNRVIPNTLLPSKKVHITWNDDAKTPFIMSITPDISELYKKADELTKIMSNPRSSNADFLKKWAEIKEWHIEIDTRTLTKGSRLCVSDGAQFVALLCHEIGHVMTESPIRLISNYKVRTLDFEIMEKLMLSNSRVLRSILLPMYTHTLQFLIVSRDRNDQKACEMAADAYVPDVYKGALVSYMNDHLLTDPDGSNLVVDAKTFDKEQEVGINLSRESIEMLKDRKDALNVQIQAQHNAPNSSAFHKQLMKFVGKNLTGLSLVDDDYMEKNAADKMMLKNTNSDVYLEGTMARAYEREYEAIKEQAEHALMEAAKITSRDLDILSVQIDDIKTPEDKMYFIHKVYDYMEAVSADEAKKVKAGKSTIPGIIKDDRLERLSEMRSRILKKDVTTLGDKYGVFVKYPAGYEG